MRFANTAIIAGGLGFAVAALTGCGSSGSLLSSSQAGSLNGQLTQISQAITAGNCVEAANALSGLQSQLATLGAGSVNQTLISNLQQGARAISSLAQRTCPTSGGAATSTTTATSTTATTKTKTKTKTKTTPTTSTTTTTPTTTTPPVTTPVTTTPTTPTTPAVTTSTTGGAGLGGAGTTPAGGGGGDQGGNAGGSGGGSDGSGGAGAGG